MKECVLQVQNARHKLGGRHPASVLIAELTPKHAGSKYWKALQVIIACKMGTCCKGKSHCLCKRQRGCKHLLHAASMQTD